MFADSLLSRFYVWACVTPLLAAIFAPFSILFDIPALTEDWFIRPEPGALHSKSPIGIRDPPACIALSAIGLGFNLFANALLLVRFSTSAPWWSVATRMSVLFWAAKVVIALLNLCIFGTAKRGIPGEGLWCAVVSLVISSLITFILVCHWVYNVYEVNRQRISETERLSVRLAGRYFMLNVTFFVVDVSLLALLASQVERWSYLQGIYFVIVTYLTIGFGDFAATHAVTRALLFIFAIVGIAQLGNIVGMLVEFFRSHSEEQREASRREYERHHQEKQEKRSGVKLDLTTEIDFLHHLGEKEEARMRRIQLVKSLTGLLVFWVVGAAIFSQLEGWGYGSGLYFVYVSFLTIGYGDYTPVTPAGRVIFVVYAIIAVPIMASFAVQAIQQVFTAFSQQRYNKMKVQKGLQVDVEQGFQNGSIRRTVVTHAEFVENWNREWDEEVRKHTTDGLSSAEARDITDIEQEDRESSTMDGPSNDEQDQDQGFDEVARLTEKILESAISLEWRARKLLIRHLDGDEYDHLPLRTAQILLKADRNVQLREVKAILKEIEEHETERRDKAGDASEAVEDTSHPALRGRSATILKHVVREDPDLMETPLSVNEHETLYQVKRYREDFAGLLAAGSRLMGLEGPERALFERRSLKVEGDDPQL